MDLAIIIVMILITILMVACALAGFVDPESEEPDQTPVLPHIV